MRSAMLVQPPAIDTQTPSLRPFIFLNTSEFLSLAKVLPLLGFPDRSMK